MDLRALIGHYLLTEDRWTLLSESHFNKISQTRCEPISDNGQVDPFSSYLLDQRSE